MHRISMFAAGLLAMQASVALAAGATVTGVISNLIVEEGGVAGGGANEVIAFQLSPAPPFTGCASNTGNNTGVFAFSAASVTDPTSLTDMKTWLLTAKASGSQVLVVYDNAGAHCDPNLGYAVPLAIEIP